MRLPALHRVSAVLGVAILAGCSGVRPQSTVEGAGAGVDAPPRTVAVTVSRVADDCDDAVLCAEIDAVRALLFTGVPGSGVPRPLIRNEQEARARHAVYFDALLKEGGHARYIVRVAPAASGVRDAWTVIVNHDALRIALEQQGVIRRFGY